VREMREDLKEKRIIEVIEEIDPPERTVGEIYEAWIEEAIDPRDSEFALVRFGDFIKIIGPYGYVMEYQPARLFISRKEWEEFKEKIKKSENIRLEGDRVLVKSTERDIGEWVAEWNIAEWKKGILEIEDIHIAEVIHMTTQEFKDILEAYLEFLLLLYKCWARSWRSVLIGPLRRLGRIQELLLHLYEG